MLTDSTENSRTGVAEEISAACRVLGASLELLSEISHSAGLCGKGLWKHMSCEEEHYG